MHATPANFTFHHQNFVKISGNLGTLLECLGDELGALHRILRPLVHTDGGIDPDRAILTYTVLTKNLPIAARLAYSIHKAAAGLSITHGTATYRSLPNRCHKTTYFESMPCNFISELTDFSLIGINIQMRLEQEHVHSVKTFTANITGRSHLKHSVQTDRWLIRAVFLANEAGPHRVM